MSQHKDTSYSFDLTDIILFLIKNGRKLFVLCALSAVLTYILTMPVFTKPRYSAKSSFYPGTTNSISSQLFYSIKDKAKDPLAFAELEVTEQYLQLLKSDAMRWRIINRFDLYKHYGIDRSDKNSGLRMASFYDDRITIRRTDFNSIEIIVEDEVPDTAAALANAIMYTGDAMRKEMQQLIAKQALAIVEKSYTDKLHQVDSIKNRLKELGAEGVYDLPNQAKGIAEVTGKGQSNSQTDKEKLKLGNYGGEVLLLTSMLEEEAINLTFLRNKYQQAQIDVSGDMSNIFVIDYAGPSWDKVYPKRFIMLLVSVIVTFFGSCILLLIIEQFKKVKHLLQNK